MKYNKKPIGFKKIFLFIIMISMVIFLIGCESSHPLDGEYVIINHSVFRLEHRCFDTYLLQKIDVEKAKMIVKKSEQLKKDLIKTGN